jgi:LemA protein
LNVSGPIPVFASPWPQIVLGVALFFSLIWLLANYNDLVRCRMVVEESRSGIDTELKRRHDLVPQLVETVKGYARHERETLQAVLKARHQAADSLGSASRQSDDENALARELRRLVALADHYPDLKTSRNFLALQHELSNTENRIQAARRFHDANVRDHNTLVESFPTNLLASAMQIRRGSYFELDDNRG